VAMPDELRSGMRPPQADPAAVSAATQENMTLRASDLVTWGSHARRSGAPLSTPRAGVAEPRYAPPAWCNCNVRDRPACRSRGRDSIPRARRN